MKVVDALADACAPPETPPVPEPQDPMRELFRTEYAAYLARRAARDDEAREEYHTKAGQRRYEPYEVESADVRPPMMQDGTPIVLDRLTLTRRSRRKKG